MRSEKNTKYISWFLGLMVLSTAISCAKPPQSSELATGIVGGSEATGSEAFATSTVLLYDTVRGGVCTGSLISENTILTAAHCVPRSAGTIQPTGLFVVFDKELVNKPNLVFRKVALSKTHDEYNPNSNIENHDIALVRFEGSLPVGYQPAELLTAEEVLSKGQMVLLAGYGITGKDTGDSGKLRYVETKIEDPNFSRTEVLLNQTEGRGACHGDSGGPAFLQVNGKNKLFGVTSRGHKDPEDTCLRYAVYTNAVSYNTWIDSTVGKFNTLSVQLANSRLAANQ